MAESEIDVLADVCAINEATLAKLIGLVIAEIINLDPNAKDRLKAKMLEVAVHPNEDRRELTSQIVKQVARSAGMRMPGL